MKRRTWRVAAAIALVAAFWQSRAPAQQQPPPAAGTTAATQEEVRSLRELVNELNERLGRIEAQAAGATQPAAAPSAPGAVPSELEDLREQVYELNKRLRQIEVQAETDKAAADAAAKKAPIVTAGGDGFSISSPDKAFQLKLSARAAYDFAFFDQDEELERAVGDEQDGTGFPYARLQLTGKMWEYITGVFEIEFAGENGQDTPSFREVYFQIDNIPYGGDRGFDLRAGHYREPFSMEDLIGVPYRTFNERSLANVFVPSYNPGIQISDALFGDPKKERLTWALGVFKEADNWPSANDSDEDQGYQITARVTGLPWYSEDGRKLLHLGLAYSRRNPDGARLNYGARPDSRLALFRYADVDNLPVGFRLRDARADDVDLLGLELAGVYGPVWLQSEYIHSAVDTTFGGDVDFDGYYAQLGWFITGESRPYRNDRGLFVRVIPKRNFGFKTASGWGAWEVAARYSAVDLQDGPVHGGEHASFSLGLNWYLNPNARITWNYTHNEVEHDLYDGSFDELQTRFQFEF